MLLMNLGGKWRMKRTDETDWIDAAVPGSVFKDLLEAGKMPDPFYRDNEYEVLELTKFDYEYSRSFEAGSELLQHDRVVLHCDGLDTLCTISLNGEKILSADNMHRTYEVDVKNVLVPGENTIHVLIQSPTEFCLRKNEEQFLTSCADAVPGISHLRKAHCMFGWDWGPQLPDSGIWRDITLQGYDKARLDDVYITQQHNAGRVELDVRVRTDRWSGTGTEVLVIVETPEGETREHKTRLDTTEKHIALEIPNPRLWWPHNLGSQPLYPVTVVLLDGQTELDRKEMRIGLRTLTIRKEKDQWGESFEFEVNGKSIFSMGANYIPEDNVLSRRSRERTDKLLKSCLEANFNTIRVWGGGYYPDDYFYDLCDEYGLIVWQDHLYACGAYDFNDAFRENIRQETADNMKRFRHHASLGIWSGNNELEYAWAYWGWKERYGEKLANDYIRQFEEFLPALAKELDPNTFYWVSSPSSTGYFDDPNNENIGDEHYWDVWHGRKPITEYRNLFPRFMSEFGLQSFPCLKTVESFTLPEDRNIFSYVMESHQKNGTGNEKILYYISENFKHPGDMDSLLYLSQLIQAEGMRVGVEHWRRNRGRCMGAIYWQLNDCWPVASWAGLDYYGRWKAVHYAARRFFAPVLVSACEEGTSVALYVTNETLEGFDGRVQWRLMDNTSQVLQGGEADVRVEPLKNLQIAALEFGDVLDTKQRKRETYLEYSLVSGENEVGGGVVFFVKPKHFDLLPPEIKLEVTEEGDRFLIEVRSSTLARFVELELKEADAIFDDNIFDLSAGCCKKVAARKEFLSTMLTVEEFRKQLTVRSLYDTF